MGKRVSLSFRGDRLRELREAAGLSQDELQRLLGFQSRASVQMSRWESGGREPSLGYLLKLSHVLDVNPLYLLGKTDDPAPGPLVRESELSDDERALLRAYRQGDSLTAMRLVLKQADKLVKEDRDLQATGE